MNWKYHAITIACILLVASAVGTGEPKKEEQNAQAAKGENEWDVQDLDAEKVTKSSNQASWKGNYWRPAVVRPKRPYSRSRKPAPNTGMSHVSKIVSIGTGVLASVLMDFVFCSQACPPWTLGALVELFQKDYQRWIAFTIIIWLVTSLIGYVFKQGTGMSRTTPP